MSLTQSSKIVGGKNMRKWKNMEKWASVFVVAVFLATTVTVNAIQEAHKSIPVHPIPPYNVLWATEYPDGLYPPDVTTDRNNDVIVCGISQNNEGLIVKYSGTTGGIIWENLIPDSVTSPGQNQNPLGIDLHCIRDFIIGLNDRRMGIETGDAAIIFGGVDTFRNTDVIAVATVYYNNEEDQPSDVYVARYASSDGELLWEKLIHFYTYDFSFAVTVNCDDDVVVAGVSGGIEIGQGDPLPIMDGWVYKLDGDDGHFKGQNHIFGILQPLPYYFDVANDSSNDIFATGLGLDIDWSGFPDIITAGQTAILTKYDGDTLQLLKTYLGDFDVYTWTQTVTVDKDNYVYIGGDIILNGANREYIVKFTNDLENIEWKLTDHYLYEGTIPCLATRSNCDVVAAANPRNLDGYMVTQIFNKNGYLRLNITEGKDAVHRAEATATAVDRNDDVITTGIRSPPGWYWYTMKCHINGFHQVEPLL
jgi:hypothetical protein